MTCPIKYKNVTPKLNTSCFGAFEDYNINSSSALRVPVISNVSSD